MRFSIVDVRKGERVDIDFADFVELIQGTTVSSAASSDDWLEMGVTDAMNIRIEASGGELVCSIFSTLNSDDIPPIRVQLVEEGETPTAAVVEHRIRALRQSYAVTYLVEADRLREAEDARALDPNADLELLLPEEDRLYVVAAAPGSFWLTIITKSAKAYKTLKHGLALPYKEGREALLRRVQADTRLRELAVQEKELDIGLKRAKGLIDTLNGIDKIKNEESKNALRDSLISNLEQLGSREVLSLPPPNRKTEDD